MSEATNYTFPVGRLVQGSLYKGQTTDAEKKPLVIKSGPNAGEPRTDYFFAVAVAKGVETHWNQTQWGAAIWNVGQKSFPNGQGNSPTFAWKVTDGDSSVPNRAGRKPCDREGYPGHWVLAFSSGYSPKIFTGNGGASVTEPDVVKLGHYVQVAGSIAGNGSQQQPGIFLNHNMVAHSGIGAVIVVGPDPTSVGFGGSLPAGATAIPATAAATAFAMPPVAAFPPFSAAVTPHTAFLSPPPAPPPAAPAHVMTPTAPGPYEAMRAAGWSDAQLIQHGHMVG